MNTTTKTKKNLGDSGSTRILKEDIKTPDDSGKTAAELQAEIENAGAAILEPAKRTVARGTIYVAEAVFQWRGSARYDQWDRLNHIHTLAKAIKENGKPLARLLVMPVGERLYVIDGHHRLAAYDTAEWTKGIPVEVFTGSLTEARLQALASNVKDKLPMTAKAKSEAAWQIVKENLGDLTAQQVADRTGVSLRTVRTMNKVWKELNARAREGAIQMDPMELTRLTWRRAWDIWANGEETTPFTDFQQDEWKERKADEIVNLIERTNVAHALLQDGEITAMALMRLNVNLPARLMDEWAGEYRELIEELAERNARPDLEF